MQKPAWAAGSRTGPVRKFEQLSVFACEGLIVIIDERPQYHGDCKIVSPKELLERVRALNVQYRGKTRVDVPRRLLERHDDRIRGSQNCMECIKEAKAMGDPFDPKVQAFWARHRSNNTVSMSFSEGSRGERKVKGKASARRAKPFDANLATQLPAAPDPAEVFVPPRRKQTAGKLILPPQ